MPKALLSLISFLVLALLISLALCLPSFSQQKHKIAAQLVLVEIIATDESEQFARGLTKDDFEVAEDGKPMIIKSLDLFDFRPSTAGSSPATEALPQVRKPRLVVIFDSMNTIKRLLEHGKPQIIDRLLDLIGRGYEIMVFELTDTGGMKILQPFTSDDQLIRRAVAKASGSIWVERAEDTLSLPREMLEGERNADQFNREAAKNMYEFEARRRLQATTTSFLAVLNTIKDFPGRKPVLLISGGFPYLNLDEVQVAKIQDPFKVLKRGRQFSAEEIFGNLKVFANSYNISFYSLYSDNFLRYVLPDIALDNYPAVSDISEIKKSEVRNLGDLAYGTGGSAMLGADKFQEFQKIVQSDLSSYYELSYVPPRKSADGAFHKIKVKTRRPGITLRHRPGYFDYDDDQKESLLFASAAFNPSLFRDIPFAGKAIPVAVGPGRFVLWMTMTLPVQTVLQEADTAEIKIIKVGLNLIDDENSLELSARINAPIRLSPEFRRRLAKARHFGFNACSEEMEFKKDRYRAVIALYDGESRTVSTVEFPLQVPDLSGPGGAILQSVFGQVVEVPDAPLKNFSLSPSDGTLEFLRYKFYPLSVNDFSIKDNVMLYLQVRGAKDEQALSLAFSASREGEQPLAIKAQEISRSRNKKANVWNVIFKLDFGLLAPANYTLQVLRQGQAEGQEAALSQIPFRLF